MSSVHKLKSIYESENSIYKQLYFDIVNLYLKFPIQKDNSSIETYSEIHHINVCWYFIHNNLKVDNTPDNKIRVLFKDHLKLHLLLCQHFDYIKDTINLECACAALSAILNLPILTYRLILKLNFSDEFLSACNRYRFLNKTSNKLKELAKRNFTKYTKTLVRKMYKCYLKYGYTTVVLKYGYKYPEYALLLLCKRYGFSFKSKRINKNILKQMFVDYFKNNAYFGNFSFIKTKYSYRFSERSLILLFCRSKLNVKEKKLLILKTLYAAYIKYGFKYIQEKFNFRKDEYILGTLFIKYNIIYSLLDIKNIYTFSERGYCSQ